MEVGKQQNLFPNGFPKLANFIAEDNDQSASIYRCYTRLTARNLLYLEAELFELERKQTKLDEDDYVGDMTAKHYSRNWAALSLSDDPRCIERKELLVASREKIKEYQDALISQEAILKMSRPHRRTVEALQHFMDGDGTGVQILSGLSSGRLEKFQDLIALRPPVELDWMTRFVRRYFRLLFVEGNLQGSIAQFSETRIAYAVTFISIVLAAILLVGAIVHLYFVQNSGTKLGFIGMYTALFAGSVGVLTNARRAELFASTAAYAAVLVVFVSGDFDRSASNAKS